VRGLVVHSAEGQLLQMVLALYSSCRLARRLHRRQQQRDQNADDRDYHQQFHERKTV